jgi:hypothetical protein
MQSPCLTHYAIDLSCRVAEQILMATGDDMDYYFATCPRITRQGQELAVISHQELNTNDPHIVWVFFNAPDTGIEMQRDFCHFLEHLMTMVHAEFIGQPAVLHIRVVGHNRTPDRKQQQSTPVFHADDAEHDDNDDHDEKKTDSDYDVPSYSSPRHVADFDAARHVDIYEANTTKKHLESPPAERTMERIAPKTTYEMAESDRPNDTMVIASKQKKKGLGSRPWRKDVRRPPLSVRPPRSNKKLQAPAPVSVIRARSTDMTVQSALTGPFFQDGSEIKDVFANSNEVKAEALRQEWIQSSVLNRGLSLRIRALLEDIGRHIRQ